MLGQVSFPDSSAQWLFHCAWSVNLQEFYSQNNRFFLFGDTVVQGKAFTKVWYEEDTGAEQPDTSNSLFYGLLRESNDSVFYKGPTGLMSPLSFGEIDSSSPEFLLMDFSRFPGDTILHLTNYWLANANFTIDSLYTVVSDTGTDFYYGVLMNWYEPQETRLIRTDTNGVQTSDYYFADEAERWFSGYGGPNYGLFEGFNAVGWDAECFLSCFESGEVDVSTGELKTCLTMGVNETQNESSILRFFDGTIVLESTNKDDQLSIYDLTGRTVFQTTSPQKKVLINHLTSGIYVVVLRSDRHTESLKIAVTH